MRFVNVVGKMKFLLVFMMLAIGGLGLGGVLWELGYFSQKGEPISFIVKKGENFSHLAHRLERQGIIRSERVLRWYVNLNPPTKKLQRGEFLLAKGMSVPGLVSALTEGKPLEYKVTVPEGYNLFQVGEILEEKGLCTQAEFQAAASAPEVLALLPTFQKGDKHPKSIEGYIYPDTYTLQKVFSPDEIAIAMVLRFREVFNSINGELEKNPIAKEYNLTPHQVITLASIVEKETGAASERPIIAGVFLNRLKKKMRLQTDPTVIYGMWLEKGDWDGKIHKSNLETYTPYNTYRIEGLPPGPIASPGINAIKAVLAPQQNEFLYFVSKNDGTHVFSKDYRSHENAVRTHQLDPNAREGKSWRDLPAGKRAVN